jgi:hypothetical protein
MRHFGLLESGLDDYSDKELLIRDSFMSVDIAGVIQCHFRTCSEWVHYSRMARIFDFFELRSSAARSL